MIDSDDPDYFNQEFFPSKLNEYNIIENNERTTESETFINELMIEDNYKNCLLKEDSVHKNISNNKKKHKKRKKINKLKNYNIRKGDWLCPNCNNINFSFRLICNKCKVFIKNQVLK